MCCAKVSARNALSPSTTSPIASLTTSSKRLICAPFWCGPRPTKQYRRAENSCSDPLARIRMTFSTLVTPTRERERESVGTRLWTSSKDRVMTLSVVQGAELDEWTKVSPRTDHVSRATKPGQQSGLAPKHHGANHKR